MKRFPSFLLALPLASVLPLQEDSPGPAGHHELMENFSPPRAQGRRNTCSLFAITALAEYEYRQATGDATARFSEEYLVWASNEATGQRGDQAMFFEALHGLNRMGISDADLMPYAGSTVAPTDEARASAEPRRDSWQPHWIRRWDTSRPMATKEIEAIQLALREGHPVACGLRWPRKLEGASLTEVPEPDKVFDGHSIVLTGFRNTRGDSGFFTFRNSLGSRWGQAGYGTLSYEYVRAYANDALWLTYEPASLTPLLRQEGESMRVRSEGACTAAPQSMQSFGAAMWSEGTHLLCKGTRGSHVELAFTAPRKGRYRVLLHGTTGPDFGTVQATINGTEVEATFDHYSGRVSPSGPLDLGEHDLTSRKNVLRITSAHKNPSSRGYLFAIDALDLTDPD